MPTLQIIVGTYEKVLHGLTAHLPSERDSSTTVAPDISFADTFLFQAHGSAIRSLALSPLSSAKSAPDEQKLILATGGSDERINLYHLSASFCPIHNNSVASTPSLTNKSIIENSRNRELGSLLHHSSSVNALYFPTRSKLLSAADDNTIAVIRTRDWTVLSSIKAPIPKSHGRPSGDTAPLGAYPAGVNHFAVHPSMKLMVTVGKGENCMRLWNLVTGKKAGVLNFEKGILQGFGQGKWNSGEGRKVEWNGVGEEFVVSFERGAVIFGLDSKPKARILPYPPTKVHQIRYAEVANAEGSNSEIIAVSTEDGRILLYSTALDPGSERQDSSVQSVAPMLQAIGQLGGASGGQKSRIKDFEILSIPGTPLDVGTRSVVVAGSSDGAILIWMLSKEVHLQKDGIASKPPDTNGVQHPKPNNIRGGKQGSTQELVSAGRLLGTYDTGNRITCLKAFVMFEKHTED